MTSVIHSENTWNFTPSPAISSCEDHFETMEILIDVYVRNINTPKTSAKYNTLTKKVDR